MNRKICTILLILLFLTNSVVFAKTNKNLLQKAYDMGKNM